MNKKKIPFLLLLVLLPVLLCGCCIGCMMLSSHKESKKLLTYYSDSPVIAARYYSKGGSGYNISELPADKLEALVQTLDSMELKYHFFHTDYFWGGQFGIELELEDGTFLTYDATELELRRSSIREEAEYKEYHIRSDFLEVTNCDFWEEMKKFFDFGPAIPYGSGW